MKEGELGVIGREGGRGYVAALDGVRGLAVMAVLMTHVGWMPFGGAGVDVFFVLSGFLITGVILGELEEHGRLGWRNFYVRRWLRLAPALFVLIALYLPFSRVIGQPFRRAAGDSAMALFYVANWTRAYGDRPQLLGHTWSLSIEEQFYIVWPVLAVGLWKVMGRGKGARGDASSGSSMARYGAAAVCAVAVVGTVVYREWMVRAGASANRVYNGLDTRADGLLAGAMLAFWMPRVGRAWGEVAAVVGVVVLGFYVAGWNGAYEVGRVMGWELGGKHSYVVPVVGTVMLLVGVMNGERGWVARGLAWGPVVWVGKISYGLYLFHYPVMGYMAVKGYAAWQIAVVGVPVAFGVAVGSYYVVERRALRLKGRFMAGVRKERAGEGAGVMSG